MCLCRSISTLCHINALLCIRIIYSLPKPSCLRRTCRHIQGSRRSRRKNYPFLCVISRCDSKSGPLIVMYLMVDHVLIFAVLHDHGLQPVHFPPCLIQKIGISIIILGDVHGSVGIGSLHSGIHRCFILILKYP